MSEAPVAPKFPRGGKKLALLLMSPNAVKIGGKAIDSIDAGDDGAFVPHIAEAAKIPGLNRKLGISRDYSGKDSPVVRSQKSVKKKMEEEGFLRGMKEQQRKIDKKHHDVHSETDESTGKVSKGTLADSSLSILSQVSGGDSQCGTILARSRS